MTRKIAFLTWGNGSQIRSFHDFIHLLDDMIYLPDLPKHDLGQYAAVVLPDGMSPAAVRPHAQVLNDYVRGGGCLVVFGAGDTAEWVDVVDLAWRPVYVQDWLWWTKPGARLEIRQPEPKHPLCDAVSERDMGWHWKGVFDHHPQAQSALDLVDGSASLFLDFRDLPGGGRLMVTTLDPHVHNGERFMPATRRFLDGFYPWLNRELGIDRERTGFRFTYLQCYDHATEWRPEELERTFAGTSAELIFSPPETVDLDATDILYIPNNADQLGLRAMQDRILAFVARGGHLMISSEPVVAWLPFLGPFEAVAPRPFTNLQVRVRHDPLGFFANMPEHFDRWEGIFGMYVRGWTPMPPGAICLTEVGPADDPKPGDWLWKYPTDDGRGGWVVMHNGDNWIRYPDRGPHRSALVRDIAFRLMGMPLAGAGEEAAPPRFQVGRG